MLILELTLRSSIHTEDIFDFLVDIVPRDESNEEGLGILAGSVPVGTLAEARPYYYVPQQHPEAQVAPFGMIVGKPVDLAMYAKQPRPRVAYMPRQMWPQQQMPE